MLVDLSPSHALHLVGPVVGPSQAYDVAKSTRTTVRLALMLELVGISASLIFSRVQVYCVTLLASSEGYDRLSRVLL